MGIVTKLLDGAGMILLETEQLNVKLSLVSGRYISLWYFS